MSMTSLVLVNLGYGLMLTALLARDILWLRSILIAAQSSLCAYALTAAMPNVALWNALFVLINIVQVLRIAHERRAIRLPQPVEAIRQVNFQAMTPTEFLAFWQRGQAVDGACGTLIAQGVASDRLIVLTAGSVSVRVGEQEVARLGAGRLLAEMSLLTGEPTSANVVAEMPVSYRYWTRETLDALRLRKPDQWTKLQAAIGHDLVLKIREVDLAAAG